ASAIYQHYGSLALKSDGTLVGWPPNSFGPGNQFAPLVTSLTNVVAIANDSDGAQGVVLKTDGTVVAWGDNSDGQTNVPPGLGNVTAFSMALHGALALKHAGTVAACGAIYVSFPPSEIYIGPAMVPDGLSNVVAIAAGPYSRYAIRRDFKIDSLIIRNGQPLLRFHAFASEHYSVEYSSNLSDASWVALPGGDIIGTGSDVQIVDTTTSQTTARFYRIKYRPGH